MHGVRGAVGADGEHVRPPAGAAVLHQDRRPLHRRRVPGADEGRARRRRGGGAQAIIFFNPF